MDPQTLLASIPTPTQADMLALRKEARQYTLVFLSQGPTSGEDEARNEHFQQLHLEHLTKLQLLGKLVLNGPTLIEHDILGVSVYAAELEDARALAQADPKVKEGYLTVEVIPWMAVPSPKGRMRSRVDKINLLEKFRRFSEPWHPKIVAELNGQYVKLARLRGEFVWHHHEEEDELFLVMQGRLVIHFRDGEVELEPGEMIVVPAGVEHKPVAVEEALVMLLESKSTSNTGNVRSELTVEELDWI